MQPVIIYGGTPIDTSRSTLDKGAEIVIATPGRLLHMLTLNALSLSDVQFVVLDEAAEFAKRSWYYEMGRIFDRLYHKDRHVWMFSSKLDQHTKDTLARKYLHQPASSVPSVPTTENPGRLSRS